MVEKPLPQYFEVVFHACLKRMEKMDDPMVRLEVVAELSNTLPDCVIRNLVTYFNEGIL